MRCQIQASCIFNIRACQSRFAEANCGYYIAREPLDKSIGISGCLSRLYLGIWCGVQSGRKPIRRPRRNNKMKIVFTSIFRPGHGGGAGRVAHELAHSFALDHEVVMVCPANKNGVSQDDAGLMIA